jgi:uncharacterized protein (UPF0371 family)
MNTKLAFDNEKYLAEQTKAITERIGRFGGKLYLEFGGKLVFDYHASRVLPGFDPNVKMRLLQKFKDKADIILCIFAGDIERRKVRADFGITYDSDTFKLIDDLREWGLNVQGVVITRFEDQPAAITFMRKLERRGVRVYTHRPIEGYAVNVERTVSEAGYGANPYVETSQPLVVVNAPGPNSGKMATCLNMLYHEYKRGIEAGYAKFETFPIWNLPLRHPVNVAYEAATADLRDVNMIDPYHLEACGETAINYNRDIEAFPLLRRILEKITGAEAFYHSPTEMGVNRAGFAIVDDEAAAAAAKQELIRRYYRYSSEYAMGLTEKETVHRVELLMEEFSIGPKDRAVVQPACEARETAEKRAGKGNRGVFCGAALELPNGEFVTGHNSPLMHAAAALILNSIKQLAEIPQHLDLLSANIIESIGSLRKEILRRETISLNLSETLIALSISSTTNPTARLAMDQLEKLRGAEVHLTHLPSPGDEQALRRIGVNLTSDPRFATNKLFVS